MVDRKHKVLVTDDSAVMLNFMREALEKLNCEVIVTADGEECLKAVETSSPDLIFLDLMLPKIHGMEILKKLKAKKETKDIKIIICTGKGLIQDYSAAIQLGADYYLVKPFTIGKIKGLLQKFSTGELSPEPLQMGIETVGSDLDLAERYDPKLKGYNAYIKLWGTRGSVPVAGVEHYRYGGNTSCLEIRDQDSLIIIDAGTGIRELGNILLRDKKINKIHLFIGHTHWDHIMGFPFFAPVHDSRFEIHIYAARGFGKSIQELFTGMLDHDYFPVRLSDMQAKFHFHYLSDGEPVQIEKVKIHYAYATHPGATLCFKIETRGDMIGYATDNEFLLGYHGHPGKVHKNHPILIPYRGMINFFSDCSTLIHEAQYTPEAYRSRVGWGHSSVANTAVLVKYTDTRRWIVVHHDPDHTDDMLIEKLQLHYKILEDCNIGARCLMGFDGMTIPVTT